MKILEFLEEDNGSFSSTRFALLVWVIGVLVVWVMNNIKGNNQPIDGNIVTILGILMTGKVAQKFGEEKPKPPTPPAPPGPP